MHSKISRTLYKQNLVHNSSDFSNCYELNLDNILSLSCTEFNTVCPYLSWTCGHHFLQALQLRGLSECKYYYFLEMKTLKIKTFIFYWSFKSWPPKVSLCNGHNREIVKCNSRTFFWNLIQTFYSCFRTKISIK